MDPNERYRQEPEIQPASQDGTAQGQAAAEHQAAERPQGPLSETEPAGGRSGTDQAPAAGAPEYPDDSLAAPSGPEACQEDDTAQEEPEGERRDGSTAQEGPDGEWWDSSTAQEGPDGERRDGSTAQEGPDGERRDGWQPGSGSPQGVWPYGALPGGPQTGWQPPTPQERAAAGMAAAALVLGVLSILCSCTVYGSLAAGGLAVILALLSKGKKPKLSGQAKAGIAAGCVGILTAVYLLFSSFHTVLTDPEANRMFQDMFEQYYGESFDDALQDALGGRLPE